MAKSTRSRQDKRSSKVHCGLEFERDERRVTSQRSVKRLDNRLGVNLETKSNLGFDSAIFTGLYTYIIGLRAFHISE